MPIDEFNKISVYKTTSKCLFSCEFIDANFFWCLDDKILLSANDHQTAKRNQSMSSLIQICKIIVRIDFRLRWLWRIKSGNTCSGKCCSSSLWRIWWIWCRLWRFKSSITCFHSRQSWIRLWSCTRLWFVYTPFILKKYDPMRIEVYIMHVYTRKKATVLRKPFKLIWFLILSTCSRFFSWLHVIAWLHCFLESIVFIAFI